MKFKTLIGPNTEIVQKQILKRAGNKHQEKKSTGKQEPD